jgi:hypothetical protein
MKKLIYFLILFAIINIATLTADNWEPYPFGKTLIYTSDYSFDVGPYYPSASFIDQYFSVRFDSVSIDSNGYKTYYSDRYRRHKSLKCVNDSIDYTSSIRNNYHCENTPYYFQEDSYTLKNDTAIFHLNCDKYDGMSGKFEEICRRDLKLPLNLKENDVFTQIFQDNYGYSSSSGKETLDIKCLSRYEAVPFNQKDSLAVFQLYDQKIFLSKKFGFIQYVPFLNVFHREIFASKKVNVKLVGVKDSIQELGIQMPDSIPMDKILPYKVGDVIKRQSTICGQTYFEIDSVTAVERTDDYISISFHKIVMDTSMRAFWTVDPIHGQVYHWTKQYNYDLKYSIKELYDIFNGPTNDVVLFASYEDKFRAVYHKLFESREIFGKDTIKQVSTTWAGGGMIDTSTCEQSFTTDIEGIEIYNPMVGLNNTRASIPCPTLALGHWYIDWYPDDLNVVGYRIGGEEWGDISIPDTTKLGINDPIVDSYNPIFPNPARDFINTAAYLGWQYQIYDLLGSCVQSGMVDAENINVAALPTGFYTVRFFKEGKQVVEKLMKE